MGKKELRMDLYTQSDYAKKIGVTPQRVYKMVKDRQVNIVLINGATLIKP